MSVPRVSSRCALKIELREHPTLDGVINDLKIGYHIQFKVGFKPHDLLPTIFNLCRIEHRIGINSKVDIVIWISRFWQRQGLAWFNDTDAIWL